MNKDNKSETKDGNFFKGFVWACALSIPLWIAFFGWIKMISTHSFFIPQ